MTDSDRPDYSVDVNSGSAPQPGGFGAGGAPKVFSGVVPGEEDPNPAAQAEADAASEAGEGLDPVTAGELTPGELYDPVGTVGAPEPRDPAEAEAGEPEQALDTTTDEDTSVSPNENEDGVDHSVNGSGLDNAAPEQNPAEGDPNPAGESEDDESKEDSEDDGGNARTSS